MCLIAVAQSTLESPDCKVANGRGFNRSPQHLDSITVAEHVADGLPGLLHYLDFAGAGIDEGP